MSISEVGSALGCLLQSIVRPIAPLCGGYMLVFVVVVVIRAKIQCLF